MKVCLQRLHESFHKSSVIWWARLQVLLGLVLGALLTTDLSPWFSNPKLLTGYLVINGAATEFMRRSNTTLYRGRLYPTDLPGTIMPTVDRMGNPL